jgi:hypothetical protein
MSAKGSQFERDIAKKLSLWWSENWPEPSDAIFWRTSQSGGRATTRAKKGRKTDNQHGDLCATDPLGQPLINAFLIELKKGYNSHTVAHLLDCPRDGKPQKYHQWIVKARQQAREAKKNWLLIVKRDKRLPIVLCQASLAVVLGLKEETHGWWIAEHNLHCAQLDRFLKKVRPHDIERLPRVS